MDQLIQILIIGLANGLIFALVALGYTLVYGIIELINFAHGDVFMLGSMLAYFLIAPQSAGAWGIFPINADTPLPLLIAQVLAVLAICMVATATLNVGHRAGRLPTAAQRAEAGAPHLGHRRELRPAERRPGLAAAPTSARSTASSRRTTCSSRSGSRPIVVTASQVFVAVVTIPLLIALSLFVSRTRQGKAMRATAQDPDTAGLMGVDVNRTIGITFLIGGALAGAAGVAQLLYNDYTVYTLGFRFGLNSFTAAVLGGIGNLQGAVLGALVHRRGQRLERPVPLDELDAGHRVRRPDRDPRLQANRPPRPAAGGPGMSAVADAPIQGGVVGWLSWVGASVGSWPGQYRSALRRKRRRTIGLTLLTLAVLIYPWLNHEVLAGFGRQVFPLPLPDDTVATFMTIFAIMAIGLNIVAGFAGLLDLGYVAFYAIGAYCAAFLASPHFGALGINLTFLGHVGPGAAGIHLPFWIIAIIAVIVVATFGALLGAPTLRLRGDYLAIVTLGFGEIVPLFFRNLSSVTFSLNLGPINIVLENQNWTGGVQGINPIDPPYIPFFDIIFDARSGQLAVYLGLFLLLIAIVVARNLERSRIGRAWGALREDETAAEMMGVNTVRTKLLAFALGPASPASPARSRRPTWAPRPRTSSTSRSRSSS